MNKIPCKCGHLKKEHSAMYCFLCFDEDKDLDNSVFRGTHLYVSDNLKYLEQCGYKNAF